MLAAACWRAAQGSSGWNASCEPAGLGRAAIPDPGHSSGTPGAFWLSKPAFPAVALSNPGLLLARQPAPRHPTWARARLGRGSSRSRPHFQEPAHPTEESTVRVLSGPPPRERLFTLPPQLPRLLPGSLSTPTRCLSHPCLARVIAARKTNATPKGAAGPRSHGGLDHGCPDSV